MEYLPTALRMTRDFLWTVLQSVFILGTIWYVASQIAERL